MNSKYEIVTVKWINFPKKSKVNLSKESAILKLTNGKSIKFYSPANTKGLTNVTIGTKLHLIYHEEACTTKTKTYRAIKAVNSTDKELSNLIDKYNPNESMIMNYILHGANYSNNEEYNNWLCDNVLKVSRANAERITNTLYSIINRDPLKKSYRGYSLKEVEDFIYKDIVRITGCNFDIKESWNNLITNYGGMVKSENEYHYFPSGWLD